MVFAACGGDDRSPTAPAEPKPFYGTPCSEYDSGADGTIDSVYTFTYDSDGFETHEVISSGFTADLTYDDDHFLLHYIEHDDSDGSVSFDDAYTRDPDGRVLTEMATFGTNVDTYAYTYDAKGRLISSMVSQSMNETASTFTYSGEHLNPATGRIVKNGVATSYAYTTSADDRTLHADTDLNEDGVIDGAVDYTYDNQHRELTLVATSHGDFAERDVTAWASNGYSSSYTLDYSQGDPLDYSYTATFDGRGRMVMTETASPSGMFDSIVSRETAKESCATARRLGPSTPHELQVAAARRHAARRWRIGNQL
jgi:YD repeat-containing protein